MSNLITFTEDFTNGIWTPNDAGMVVTANTAAAPAFAGVLAGLADKLEDTTAALVAILLNSPSFDIPADTADYILSIYVKKDAITSRFPEFMLFLSGGTSIFTGISLNTSDGSISDSANAGAPTTDKGVVNVDSLWWRAYFRIANNGTNTLIRAQLAPAQSDSLGGGNNGALTGDITVWGINITNTSSLQAYEPSPFYSFGTTYPFRARIGARRF